MNSNLTINLMRALFVAFSACIGSIIGLSISGVPWTGLGSGLVFGLVIVLSDRMLQGLSLRAFSSATFGLLVGYVFARLLLASNVLRGASDDVAWIASLVIYVTFAYLGMMLAIRSNRDEFALIVPYVRFRQATTQEEPLVVDSNVIIDGRLADLCATGFISSSLVVPRFILHELQRLADSSDAQKRDRGRGALDRLQQMQRNPALSITIHESGSDQPGIAVDTRLVQAAKLLDARLLTNDTGLCAIARLQGVSVLNLHDLARALRPSVEPGRPLDLTLVREGRDAHQAVGYLNDGTMIVVNHARALLGQTVGVVVTSTLQTSAGRLFFAELKQTPAETH